MSRSQIQLSVLYCPNNSLAKACFYFYKRTLVYPQCQCTIHTPLNYMGIFLVFLLFFLLFCYFFRNKNGLPTKWPIIGTLPAILKNTSRIHDYIIEVAEKCQFTLCCKGPWFTNMTLLVSVDPANAHHVFTKNFGNYPKGPKFREIYEILGDGVFSSDSEIWKFHRKMGQSTLSHPQFNQFTVNKIWEKIETGLIPILDHASMEKSEIELQDLLGRLTLDTICNVMMDYDPQTLSPDFHDIPFSKAIQDAEKAIFYRHALPPCVWKFQRWLDVGLEKKHKEACKIVDDFLYECISKKKKQIGECLQSNDEVGVDLMTLYMEEISDDKFLRDTILAYFVAGQETTSITLCWLFYLLSKNPQVLSKIKEELNVLIGEYDIMSRNFQELSEKVIYLHAAICESLRLYPPLAFNSKSPVEPDTLPSGHRVDSTTQIIFDMYAMGRMKSIWGEDCYEFKPERWILDSGSERSIKYEPSHKFLTFGSGPRTCLGKNMSFTMMKAVAMTIISKYHIQPVKEHHVVPEVSTIITHMKYGFKVNVSTSSVKTK